MVYFAFAIFLMAVLLWYGNDALPVVGVAAIIALYFMAQGPEQPVVSPAVQPLHHLQPQVPRLLV